MIVNKHSIFDHDWNRNDCASGCSFETENSCCASHCSFESGNSCGSRYSCESGSDWSEIGIDWSEIANDWSEIGIGIEIESEIGLNGIARWIANNCSIDCCEIGFDQNRSGFANASDSFDEEGAFAPAYFEVLLQIPDFWALLASSPLLPL